MSAAWSGDAAVRTLVARGALWEPAPGLVGLRGEAAALRTALEGALATLARAETGDDWQVPPAIPLAALHRAGYFASFPQWLTVAAHLRDDEPALARLADAATADAVRDAAAGALAAPAVALPPAVCYHVYAALAGTTLDDAPRVVAAQGCCWRHEGDRLRPLERGWAFTMRESVCLAAPDAAEAFRARARDRAVAFAEQLGLAPSVVPASDPFFAPTARGRALLQRLKALKHELLLPIGDDRTIAAASFNHHERFFGDAFDVRLADGTAAASACAAYGVERWLLALLAAHGPDARDWPDPSAAADAALDTVTTSVEIR